MLSSALWGSACGSSSAPDAGSAGTSGAAASGGAGKPSALAGDGGTGDVLSGAGGSASHGGSGTGAGSVGVGGTTGRAGSSGAAGGVGLGGAVGLGGSAGSAGKAGAGNAGSAAASGAGSAGVGSGSAGFQAWPSAAVTTTLDPVDTYSSDLSGLHYEPAQGAAPAVLWAVQNSPSMLFRLLWNGTVWASDPSNGWSSGKTLRFVNGQGAPDSEGVTKLASGTTDIYVSSERDGSDNDVSRMSVLLFDGGSSGSTLSATREWNLTSDLPKAGANLGLEAIAWVPDAYLVSKGFLDESTHLAYAPADYASHAGGIFFVGVEQTGLIYGFALDHAGGGFTRVATIDSGNSSVMELSFDRDVGYLWAVCDDSCDGRTKVLDLDTRVGSATLGKFYVRRGFERPSSMPNLNNEGFTVTTESTCLAGFKAVFYAEDGSTMGHAIRRSSIPCGPFL